jgi:hypothetical protein
MRPVIVILSLASLVVLTGCFDRFSLVTINMPDRSGHSEQASDLPSTDPAISDNEADSLKARLFRKAREWVAEEAMKPADPDKGK